MDYLLGYNFKRLTCFGFLQYAAEFGGNDISGVWYEDRIWSHAWELDTPLYQGRYAIISDKYDRRNSNINRVGVAVHELAQVLGAPTLHQFFSGLWSWIL